MLALLATLLIIPNIVKLYSASARPPMLSLRITVPKASATTKPLEDGETTPKVEADEISRGDRAGSLVSVGSVTIQTERDPTPEKFYSPLPPGASTPPELICVLKNKGASPHTCENPELTAELDAKLRREEIIIELCGLFAIPSTDDLSFVSELLFYRLVDIECEICLYRKRHELDAADEERITQLQNEKEELIPHLRSSLV